MHAFVYYYVPIISVTLMKARYQLPPQANQNRKTEPLRLRRTSDSEETFGEGRIIATSDNCKVRESTDTSAIPVRVCATALLYMTA